MRVATLADAEELAELDLLLFPEYCLNEQSLRIEIAIGEGLIIVRDGKIVAYMLLRKDGPLLDITRLGVHPDYRYLGYGSRLLAKAKRACARVMLTVLHENKDAIRLYLRNGFRIVGNLNGDGWVMEHVATADDESRTSRRQALAEP